MTDLMAWAGGGVILAAVVLVALVSSAKGLARRDLTGQRGSGASPVEFAEVVNSARNMLLQSGQSFFIALGALGALGTLIFTAQSVDASRHSVDASRDAVQATRDGIITDLYTKAVEELSSPDRGVRIGGVYALERIANNSARDQPTIVAVLAAFLQDHRAKVGEFADRDAQAAAAVLARRNPAHDGKRRRPLDLSGIVISGAELPQARFATVVLSSANLGGVDFTDADLTGAELGDTDLSGAFLIRTSATNACLSDTNLDGADLMGAKFGHADLTRAHFNDPDQLTKAETTVADADFTGAILADTDLRGVDLSKATGLTSVQLAYSRIDARTKLPPGVGRPATKKKTPATFPHSSPCAR